MDKDKKDKEKKHNDSDDNDDETIEKPSYTYWKRDDLKNAQPHPQPQPITQPIQETTTNANKVASAWNSAGTWEEKRLKKNQIEDFCNLFIKDKPIIIKDSIQLNHFDDISGDVYYVYSRGKIKFAYECEIKVNVIGIKDLDGESTSITVKEVSNTDIDANFEYELESADKKSDAKKAQVINIFKGNTLLFEKAIREMFEILKEEFLK